MDSVLRSIAVYLFVLVVFRISGKRSLSQITTFDFILLLIISEATQQALLGNDFSRHQRVRGHRDAHDTRDRVLLDGRRMPAFGRAMESLPVVVVEHGKLLHERADQEGVTLTEFWPRT